MNFNIWKAMFQTYELFYMINHFIYICMIKVFKDITIIPK